MNLENFSYEALERAFNQRQLSGEDCSELVAVMLIALHKVWIVQVSKRAEFWEEEYRTFHESVMERATRSSQMLRGVREREAAFYLG